MSVNAVKAILAAAAPVTALVGNRINPVALTQGQVYPAVRLSTVALVPTNHLTDDASLDQTRVQVDAYAATYASAHAVADACRAALRAANVQMELEIDGYEPAVDPPLYVVTQDYRVWP